MYPTSQPTRKPTLKPTRQPTRRPTLKPTRQPTLKPTRTPTVKPTRKPTTKPTAAPENPIVTYINEVSLSERKLRTTGASAEEKALKFVSIDDPLRLDPSNTLEAMRLRTRFALLCFYFQQTPTQQWTGGFGDNWLSANECQWYTIKCDEGQKVKSIESWGASWAGTIPKDIGLLSDLTVLDIQQSYLVGTLPPTVGHLTKLQQLQLFGNALTGPLPDSIGQWSDLTLFNIHTTQFDGTIPSSIATGWPKIAEVLVFNTNFVGPLPFLAGECPYSIHDCENPCSCCTFCI
jgi:PT repeat